MSPCYLCPPDLNGCYVCCITGEAHLTVPQRPYVSRQGASMERNFEAIKITFQKGELCGIPVKDAISKNHEGLKGRDSRPFEGSKDVAHSVTLRIEWPGYPPWTGMIRTWDSKGSLTLAFLATEVCVKGIKRFIDDMKQVECTEPIWRVGGPKYFDVDNFVLVSLQRASYGTWETSIRLLC